MANTYKSINVSTVGSTTGSGNTGGTVSSGAALSFTISQASHGLSVLNSVYFNGAQWVKAQADAEATLGTHVVTAVPSSDVITISQSGLIEISSHGLAVGEIYYTSESNAGQLDLNEGITYSNPKLQVIDANNVVILDYRPSFIDNTTFGQSSVILFQNQLDVDIPDLKFDSAAFVLADLEIIVEVQSSLAAKESFEIRAVFDSVWELQIESTGGDSQVDFTIDPTTGQIRYTAPTYSGFVQGEISYKYELMTRSI